MTPPESVAICSVVVCVKFAFVPVIVAVTPVGLKTTVESAVSVIVDDWPAFTVGGLKLAVMPPGRPEMLSAIGAASPDRSVVLIA